MEHQQPSLDTPSDMARRWQTSPVLSGDVLERLREINRAYLDFLASEPFRSAANARAQSPDPPVIRLMNLEPAVRSRLSRCPFTLFSARFHDGAFWTNLTQTIAVHEPTHLFSKDDAGRRAATAFAELVLFFAWHLAHANPPAARIALGMSDQTLTAFKGMSLTYLQYLSTAHSDLVTLRWPERTTFWNSFLNTVQRGDEERISEMHSLGIQMIAAELTPR